MTAAAYRWLLASGEAFCLFLAAGKVTTVIINTIVCRAKAVAAENGFDSE
jgi:hypothetical protein